MLETFGTYGENYFLEFLIIDATVSIIFATEYIYRFLRASEKKTFVLKWMNIIDFLSFAPFVIGLMFSSLA